MRKLYHTLPKELIDALPTGDIEAVRRFRATLDGTEEIYIRDTVPLFDLMTKYMRKDGNEEELRELDVQRAKLVESEIKTSLWTVCANLERTIEECLIEAIKRESPAAYAMREMLSGRRGDLGGRQWLVPAPIGAAMETRRPELLIPLRRSIESGKTVLTSEAYTNVAEVMLDYVKRFYTSGGTPDQDRLYTEGVESLRSMIEFGKSGGPISTETSLALLLMVEDTINDMIHRENTGGIRVADGQGRSKSILSLFA